MAPLTVDPAALDGAGDALVDVGKDIGLSLSTLTGTLSGCGGMCGDDPVGEAMGQSYDSAAAELVKAIAAARNGTVNLGDGVRMSAHNYSLAEAQSDGRGRAEPLPLPASSGPLSASEPPTSVGGGIPAPPGFGWVSKYIGIIWPTADSAQLRSAAGAWIAAGTSLLVTQTAAAPALGTIGAQQIPEAEAMGQAFADALDAASQVMSQATSIAATLNSYADTVDEVHAAIIDLLARICDPMTGFKVVWDFLTDDDESEIKQIAEDIKTVVDNFATQMAALAAELAPMVNAAGEIASAMLELADKEWEQFLQGNPVGQYLDDMAQAVKGFGLQGWELVEGSWTYSPQRAVLDPHGVLNDYKSLITGMAPLVGLDEDGLTGTGDAWLKVGKDTVHWDLWGTNPAEALGRSLFDVATFFVPGGGLTKVSRVGHGAADAAGDLARAAPHVPEGPRTPEIPRAPEAPELPAVAPGTPVPHGGAPVSPSGPGSGGAPVAAPSGPSGHHGPTSSPAPAAAGDGGQPPGSFHPAAAASGDAGRADPGRTFSPVAAAASAGDGGVSSSVLPSSAAVSAPAGSPGGLSAQSGALGDNVGASAGAADGGRSSGAGGSSDGGAAGSDSSGPGKSDKDLVSVGAGAEDISASVGSSRDLLPPSDTPGSGGGSGGDLDGPEDGDSTAADAGTGDRSAGSGNGGETATVGPPHASSDVEPPVIPDIADPSKFVPADLSGLTPDQIRSAIPDNWQELPSKSGDGAILKDSEHFGRQIRIMPGYPPGSRPDPITWGPYALVSQNGIKTKVPLAGNPVLEVGN